MRGEESQGMHSCQGESCDHDHHSQGPDRGNEYTLYTQIHLDHIRKIVYHLISDV